MPIITVSNHKGGVGKTTSALNLAAALQEVGKRVLLVDFDPQGSLSVATGILDVDAVPISVGDLLVAQARDQLNPDLEIYGILLTMVDSRPHAQRVVASVRRSLKDQVPIFQTEIAYDVSLKDAAELGKSILDLQAGKQAANTHGSAAPRTRAR